VERRRFLFAPLILLARSVWAEVEYPAVERGVALVFPRDHGSHPRFRTEWWYVTGWVHDNDGRDFGVQVTFFRTRPGIAENSASRFAPKELLFAHAAIADPAAGRLRHDQRSARAGWGLAEASETTTDVAIGDWSLRLSGDTYVARVSARDFAFTLSFAARVPVLLQGERGVSRKGPRDTQASYYYSRPQLTVDGTLSLAGRALAARGTAWLDHEWSSEYLAPGAKGWDWVGINLDDGGALMAFRIRAMDGSVLWAGATLREASGAVRTFDPAEVEFSPLRQWRSARTGVAYPVAFRVTAGALTLDLEPLFDDQELDARASVGIVYWEGAIQARSGGRAVGRGYLELTGYAGPLKM
jgi:predicted secreted hydrolase